MPDILPFKKDFCYRITKNILNDRRHEEGCGDEGCGENHEGEGATGHDGGGSLPLLALQLALHLRGEGTHHPSQHNMNNYWIRDYIRYK